MAIFDLNYSVYDVAVNALCGSFCLLLLLMLTYHFFIDYDTRGRVKTVLALSVISIFVVHISWQFFSSLSNTSFFSSHNLCQSVARVGITLFGFGKFCTYSFFVLRLATAFGDVRHLRYPKSYLWGLSGAVVVGTVAVLLIVLKFLDGVNDEDGVGCRFEGPTWLFVSMGVIDALATIFFYVLFTRKIHDLGNLMNEENTLTTSLNSTSHTANRRVMVLVRKIRVLTVAACLSSVTAFVLSGLFAGPSVWLSVDAAVNMFCLFLMFSFNDELYRCCCLCVADAPVEESERVPMDEFTHTVEWTIKGTEDSE